MDEIRIDGLKVFAYHGVLEEERKTGQEFIINAVMKLPLQQAGIEDELELTVSYADVCSYIASFMRDNTFRLIESCAEGISTALFKKYAKVCELELEVKKPQAPIAEDFDCVSVKIFRKRHRAYVAYGSNTGDPEHHIEDGIASLDRDPMCRVKRMSGIMKTTPYGGVIQDDFLNGVLELSTLYEPQVLLRKLKEIEKEQGRVKTVHWGPRTLDLDIILFDDMVIKTDELIIPHPDMCNRDFVMKPLAQIAPDVKHPVLNKTMKELAEAKMEKHII